MGGRAPRARHGRPRATRHPLHGRGGAPVRPPHHHRSRPDHRRRLSAGPHRLRRRRPKPRGCLRRDHSQARGPLAHQRRMTMTTTIASPRASLRFLRTRGFGRLVLTEGKVWVRDKSAVFWTLLFPTVLLVGQAVIAPELRQIASGDTWAGTPFYGTSVINVILPAMLALPIGITALLVLPATFGGFREKGILRRFSATPMRPQSMFAAHFIINVTMALAGALIAVIVTSALFNVVSPNTIAI